MFKPKYLTDIKAFKSSKVVLSFSAKLVLLAITSLAIGLFLDGGKVSAIEPCPQPGADATVPEDWGIQEGGLEHSWATVAVYAYNAKDGVPLNVNYRLNSDVNRDYDYGPPPEDLDVPDELYPSARIFKYPAGSGRTAQHWFKTGQELKSPSRNCAGWDEIGPGISKYVGNGFVLDCQERDVNNKLRNNKFWIDSISTPTGAAGEWGGSWTIKLSTGGGALMPRGYPMNYNNAFSVTNGQNARINLIWTPNPKPPDPPPPVGDCAFLEVTGSKLNRRRVEVSRISGGDKFYDGNPDGTHAGNIDAWVPRPPGEEVDGAHTKRWNYKAKDRTIHIKITQSEWKDNTGDGVANPKWVDTVLRDDDVVCYDATCDLGVTGNVTGRPNGVQSRSGFNISAHVYNRADPPNSTPLYAQVDGRPLILASSGSPVGFWYNPGAPNGLDKKGHSYQTWNVTEPGWSIGNYGVGAKLYYDFDPAPGIQGGDFVVADCSGTSYDVYKQFHLDVSAEVQLNPTVEDPTQARFIGRADGSVPDYPGGIDVNYNATSQRTPYGGGTQTVDSRTGATGHTPVVYDYSYTPPSNAAGDKYSLDFCVYQTDGWIGPSNQFSSDTYGDCSDDKKYVYDRPYLKVYGADVVSGSNFKDGSCSTAGNNKKIRAFRSTSAAKSGSGTQFAALAYEQISGFGSAGLRTLSPVWPTGLTFANTGHIDPGSSDQPNDGGFFAGEAICSQDFYATKKNPIVTTAANVNINTSPLLQNKKQTLFNRSGNNLTISSNGADFNKQSTIFVDGNVIINNNIKFQAGKYLAIIAKGNIYINKNVTQLDGLYIAQPRDDGSRGSIYTCTNGTSVYAVGDLYTNCRTQLVINGAFAANSVKFLRVAGSLRDSKPREAPNFATGTGTRPAEIFNFSPEIYLYYMSSFEDSAVGQPYDYITTLPPVL
jgi:hypothetical protein